jgi:uncharacterized protein (TIGR04141 family)
VSRNKVLSWLGLRPHLLTAASGRDDHAPLAKQLRFFDAQQEQIGSSTILELLAFEWRSEDAVYVLSDGELFRIAGDLVADTNADLDRCVRVTRLPAYRAQTEGEYNRAVLSNGGWRSSAVVLDGCLVRLRGQTSFEACDILTDRGEFIHVKRKARSSTLSHLWAQGTVSAQLLRRHDGARAQVRDFVRERCDDADLIRRLHDRVDAVERPAHDSTGVFALVGSWQRTTVTSLPFFSRIALRDACARVRDLGFTPVVEFVSGP